VIDLKHHIITIVTIFISLGIGILIGSTMGGNELIIKKQQQLIGDLEGKLTQLRRERNEFERELTAVQDRLEANMKFQKKVLPLVVKDQLKGSRVLMITGDNIDQTLQDKLIQLFQLAGVKEVKVKTNDLKQAAEFNKILFLGDVAAEIKNKYDRGNAEMKASFSPEELASVSDLVKVVFRFTSKDLTQLGRGEGEENFRFSPSLQ
jgi:hypothetical protein